MKNLNFIVNRICANTPPCCSKRTSRFVWALVMMLTLGVGQMWGAPITASTTIADYATANSWAGSSKYKSWNLDSHVTITASPSNGSNTGQYNSGDKSWRLYKSESSTLTIAVDDGYELESFTLTFTSANNGSFKYGNTTIGSGTEYDASGETSITTGAVTGTSGSGSNKKNGVIQITAIEVKYSATSSCTDPSTLLSITSSNTATEGTNKTLTTNGGNNGSVSWSVENGTGSATVSDNILTPTNAGTVTVTATQEDNGGKCGKVVQQTITISKASATITLSDANGTSNVSGTHYSGDSYSLPTTAATCTGKTLVGWSTVEIPEEGAKPSSNYYDKGTSVSLVAGNNKFYAVYATKLTDGSSTPAQLSFTYGSHEGWTLHSEYDKNSYYLLQKNSYIESPTINDLSSITSIVIGVGSFASKGAGSVSDGSTTYASFSIPASNSNNSVTLQPQTNPLSGSGKIRITNTDGSSYTTNSNQQKGTRFYSMTINYTVVTPPTYKSDYATTCCTPLGQINGPVTLSQVASGDDKGKLKATWSAQTSTAGWADDGIKIKFYKVGTSNDTTCVHTSDALANTATAYTWSTVPDKCATYFARFVAVHGSDDSYCAGDVEGGESDDVITAGYSVDVTGVTNVTPATAFPATTCASGFNIASMTPGDQYELPTSITVTGASHTWNSTTGALTISNVTGDVTITITGSKKACSPMDKVTVTPAVTYNGATLSWSGVDHVSKYKVYIKTNADVEVEKDEDIASSTTSYTVSEELEHLTTYKYSVVAVSEDEDTYCSSTQDGTFTTVDYPAATLTLSEVGGEDYNLSGSHKLFDVVKLPSTLTYAGCTGKVLVGWSSVEIANPGAKPTSNYWDAGADYTLSSTTSTLYAVYATETPGSTSWDETALSSLGAGDVFVIVGNNGSNYAMTNNNGTSNPPAASSVTVSSTHLTGTIADNIKWNISGNATDGYVFYPNGSTTTWLYCTGDNNGVRVGTNANKTFKPNNASYLQHVGTSRYVGVYNSSDWRCYTSSGGNIANQTFKYYKLNVTAAVNSNYTTACAAALANPTFDPAEDAEEEYLAAQDLTINGPKDATIYYTMTTDGTEPDDPTDESDEYSSVISMNSRATYWIKAFAKKDASVSEIVEAKYNINLPFTVAEAIAEIPKEGNERAKTYIDGIVCTAGEEIDEGTMIYYISDDGTETNRICIWYGKGLDNADFTNVTDLKVGDKVRVYGLLNNFDGTTHGHYYVDNSYLTYLQSATVSSIEIGGTATKTAYTAGDNTFSYAGLTATATYNTGYVKDVTSEATWKANSVTSYTVTETENVSVTATYGGQTSDATVVGVTYTTKTVKSIYLEYESTYTYKGMALPKPKVYAKYVEEIADEEITSLVEAASGYDTESAYNKDVVDTYTIKVAYQSTEATYTVEVRAIFNDVDHPYTPSEATTIIEDAIGQVQSTDYIYVAGKVSAIEGSIDSNTLKYYISNDGTTTGQLYVYKGKYINNANFTNNNILVVGDEVVVQAQAQNYEGNLPELKSSQVMKHYRAPQFTFDDIVAGDEFEYDYSTDMAVTPTKNTGNAAFTLESDDESIVSIVDGKLHAAGVGTTKITASREATNLANQMNYSAKTAEFYVTVIAKRTRYAVTFDDGGATSGTAPEAIDDQLAGATVNLPASCSYSWPKHGFTGWAVTAGETPVEVTDGHFTMPEANVTITAQWAEIATTQIIFNVNGSTNVVAAVDVPQNEEYEFTQTTDPINGYTFVGWAESEEEDDVETELTTIDSYTPAVNEESKTLYAVFTRADNSNPNIGKYSKATNAPSKWDAEYLLVYEAEGNTANVWNGTDANGCYATATISNNMIEKPSGAVTLTVAKMTGGHSLLIGGGTNNGKYVGAFASNQADFVFSNSAVAATLSYDNENNCALIYIGSRYIQYNTQSSGRFRGYASGQQKVQLYKKITAPIYYTTAPAVVYDVEYALGGGAWKENEGCNDVKVKAGKTYNICEDQPVRDHFNFVKWQIGGVDASGTITVNANTTITAVWDPKAESNVTYKAGIGTGSDVVVEDVEEGTEVTLKAIGEGDGQANFTKSGYDFVGWLNNDVLQKAGETFEMPTTDVTLIAQWKKQNVVKMSLITDASQLMNGMEVIFGYIDEDNSNNSAVNGDITGTNKFFTSVTSDVTFNNDNTVTFGSGALVLTIEKADGGWKLRKNATNYLTNSGDNLSWSTEENATKWSISFEDDNAKIATGSYWIQYNSSSPRFKTYSSTQKAIQLYGKATVVNGTTSISEIGYVEGDVIVLNNNAALTVDANIAPTTVIVPSGSTVTVNDNKTVNANTVIVENGGTLNIYDEGTVKTTETLIIHSTLGKGTGTGAGSGNNRGACGQITNGDNIAVNGDVYLELELTQDAKASAGWYAFSVPFPVDAMNGIYYGDTKLTNEVGYAIMSHYGDLRAQNQYAWKKFRGIMQPGVFYVITVGDTDYKTLRFKKVAGEALVASTDVAVSEFPSQTGNDADGAWNGIGNPNLAISNLATSFSAPMQFYDHKKNSFTSRNHSMNLVVGSAFFIQYDAASTVSIPAGTTSHNGYLAPQREQNAVEETIYEVELTNVTTGEMEDNLFLTAREDATNEYVIGRDLAKMSMGTAKCAQMWVPAYGTQLCAADFPLVNGQAAYPLTITAPAAGNYSISTVANENADIYLTLDGSIIWNLSMGAYELELPQGTTNGYGLLLQAKAPNTATGVDSVQPSEVSIQKVIIDEHVYILRGEQMYDVTGKMVK